MDIHRLLKTILILTLICSMFIAVAIFGSTYPNAFLLSGGCLFIGAVLFMLGHMIYSILGHDEEEDDYYD